MTFTLLHLVVMFALALIVYMIGYQHGRAMPKGAAGPISTAISAIRTMSRPVTPPTEDEDAEAAQQQRKYRV